MNVVTPTWTVYRSEKRKATGTGVIIAPGGAFVALAVSLESYDLARGLQERGVAAFVLKYRVPEKKQEGIPENMDMDEVANFVIADCKQAIKVVREHAAERGVTPDVPGPTTRTRLFFNSTEVEVYPGLNSRSCDVYLSFKVVNANSAKIRLAIQKRTIILDSDQPSSSK